MPNAHVLGLGKSGIAAARLLKLQGWDVTMSDRNSSPSLCLQQQQLQTEGINVALGSAWNFDTIIPQLVVVSPGVPWDLPALVKARSLNIETIGEMELAWRNLQSSPWVGITGTNGKTTTTALIAAIFQSAGFNAPACGNIGYAACDLALEYRRQNGLRPATLTEARIQESEYHSGEVSSRSQELRKDIPIPNRSEAGVSTQPKTQNSPLDWVIAEISSYQIESSPSIAPQIGVWTTFTPDHLSRHKTLENYYNIKAHLLRQSQIQVLNGDDAYLRQVSDRWSNAYWTSIKGKANFIGNPNYGSYIEDGWVISQNQQIVKVSALRMSGEHNHQNLLMAVTVARLAGIEQDTIAQAVANFPGVPHRLEHICTWQEIDFINDSKATNYDAADVGLSSVATPVILIAGGEAKAGDDTKWLQTIQTKAASVLLIGNAAPLFAQRFKQVGYSDYEIVETLDQAVPKAAQLAQQYQARVVLLSPACASFDQYENFEQRGDHFRQLCQELLQ